MKSFDFQIFVKYGICFVKYGIFFVKYGCEWEKYFAREVLGLAFNLKCFFKGNLLKSSVKVLKSPDIPSILIELGFLTNKYDEKNLKNKKYLSKLCETISLSINKYLRNNVLFN